MNHGSTPPVDPRQLRWGTDAGLRARRIRQSMEKRSGGRPGTIESAPATARGVETIPEPVTHTDTKPPPPQAFAGSTGRAGPAMPAGFADHPAAPWLTRVPGMNFVLAAQLLSRLDIQRAATPSSFWAYCGFATVAATTERCDVCGFERAIPEDASQSTHHLDLRRGLRCNGRLRRSGKSAGRVPQAPPGSSVGLGFDPQAKKICYSLGFHLREARHRYESFYLHHRNALDEKRPDWEPGRKHVNALRRMQKLFLVHLYVVWSDALGRPAPPPKIVPPDTADWTSPWSMTGS
jgi:hypothetical protein